MKHSWTTRLIQASPVVVLALIAGVWFSVPWEARMVAVQSPFLDLASSTDALQYRWPGAQVEAMQAINNALNEGQYTELGAMSGLPSAGSAVASAVDRDAGRLYGADGQVVPDAIPDSSDVWEPLREHEALTGGRVAAYLLPTRKTPQVAMSALADASVLTDEERREFETSGTIETLRRSLRAAVSDGTILDLSSVGAGSGNSVGDRYATVSLVAIGEHYYETYVICWNDQSATCEVVDTYGWESIEDGASQVALARTAKRAKGVAFVVGPIETDPVPLRLAAGVDPPDAEQLAALMNERRSVIMQSTDPFTLTPEMSDLTAGATWGSMVVTGRIRSADASNLPGALVLIGTYDTHPSIPGLWDAIGDTPIRRVQVWLAARMATVLSALGVLLVVSLIASPVAFILERKRFEQLDIERERERVQREARERVIDRLTRLSDEMDRSAANAGDKVGREVRGVSDDIQSTVTALKSILGEASRTDRDEHD